MQLVDENTDVVVGRFYNVRCAHLESDNETIYYVPVIGHAHKDPQFGINTEHYHIDGRFINRKSARYQVDESGKTNKIISIDNVWTVDQFKGIVVRKLRCKRTTTGIIPPKIGELDYFGKQLGEKYHTWYASMVGKSCKGKKCPHLGTMMKETNGVLVCPLHNLHGCVKTEKIIKQ